MSKGMAQVIQDSDDESEPPSPFQGLAQGDGESGGGRATDSSGRFIVTPIAMIC
jgi:hypothetical protein